MSEVLSQYEIDSLLNALNSGELDSRISREEKTSKKLRFGALKVLKGPFKNIGIYL